MSRDRTQPDWLLERAVLGEAPGVSCDPDRRAALEASDRQILAALPPARVAAEVERRYRRLHNARPARRPLVIAIAAGAIALLVFLAVGRPSAPLIALGSDPPEVTRSKGDPRLVVHRKLGNAIERLADGARAARGDVVQLSYIAAGQRFGVIVSVDGRGAVTVHLPICGESAAELAQGGAVPLPDAYELDDAPGFERFILVTGRRRFPVEAAHRAATQIAGTATARTRRLDLPAELEQQSFLLRKDTSP